MNSTVSKITAVTDAPQPSYGLGIRVWTVSGDTVCNDGQPYKVLLKLTGCNLEGEFTCEDGQCIRMDQRCNQLPNCRDKSDERGCERLVLEEGYIKNVPPITANLSGADESILPVHVKIAITLMKVVEIEETDHSIRLQFEINLQWRENRATYYNLKDKTSLNAFTDHDISKLWLPLVIYDNTDQKESTRLGENWEWVTRVSVVREGNIASRSGLDEVEEVEIFKGEENTLTMTQTYTWEFQCKYKLQHYPFDTQVGYLS